MNWESAPNQLEHHEDEESVELDTLPLEHILAILTVKATELPEEELLTLIPESLMRKISALDKGFKATDVLEVMKQMADERNWLTMASIDARDVNARLKELVASAKIRREV